MSGPGSEREGERRADGDRVDVRDGVAAELGRRESVAREQLTRLNAQHADLVAAAAGASADDEHDPEGTTLAWDREQVAALQRQAEADVAELAAARARIAAGTYGVCEVCGRPIAAERLAARPTARACITCASRRPA